MLDEQRDPEREVAFGVGLTKLGAGCRQEVDDLIQETYIEALCYQVTPEDWTAYVREANQRGRYQWFPKIHELLEDLAEWRAERARPLTALPLRSPEQIEEDHKITREGAKRWLKTIEETLAATPAPTPLPKAPVTRTIPEPVVDPEADARHRARLDELKRQAEALRNESAETSEAVNNRSEPALLAKEG